MSLRSGFSLPPQGDRWSPTGRRRGCKEELREDAQGGTETRFQPGREDGLRGGLEWWQEAVENDLTCLDVAGDGGIENGLHHVNRAMSECLSQDGCLALRTSLWVGETASAAGFDRPQVPSNAPEW